MMDAKVTTIITSYNRPDSLTEAIKSVRNQTFQEWQLIICDNTKHGVTRDRIQEIGQDAEKEDARILFMQNEPIDIKRAIPYAVQINRALVLAQGKYITYLCDDDMYAPDHLQICLNTFKKFIGADVVYSGIMIQRENGHQTVRLATLVKACGFYSVDHITVMHKKEVLDTTGNWSEAVEYLRFGDAELWLRFGKNGYRMYPTGEITCVKTILDDSLNLYGGAETCKKN